MSGGGVGGEHEPARRDPDSGRIAGVERAVLVHEAHVVRCVPGRREALEADGFAADDVDVLLRDGSELAPELVERAAVEAARARLEP